MDTWRHYPTKEEDVIIELTGNRRVSAARRCDHCGALLPEMVLRSGETGEEECYHWRCAVKAHPEMAKELANVANEVQP